MYHIFIPNTSYNIPYLSEAFFSRKTSTISSKEDVHQTSQLNMRKTNNGDIHERRSKISDLKLLIYSTWSLIGYLVTRTINLCLVLEFIMIRQLKRDGLGFHVCKGITKENDDS